MHSEISPRRPLLAATMSFILPGFGQLYNGEVNRAIWLFLAFTLLAGPGVVAIALNTGGPLMLPLLIVNLGLALGLWIWGVLDAWRSAQQKKDYVLAGWQTSGAYAVVVLTCNLLILPGMAEFVRSRLVESFSIAGSSMEPTLEPHDLVFADKRYNCPGCGAAVARGDVAIFTYPNDRTLTYVKRIIALPGDHVRISGREIWLNGTSLSKGETADSKGAVITEGVDGREWRTQWRNLPGTETTLTVPPGEVFVLGDNRTASKDSREFGSVPLVDVVGRVRQVWFSWGDGGVRWERLGIMVR